MAGGAPRSPVQGVPPGPAPNPATRPAERDSSWAFSRHQGRQDVNDGELWPKEADVDAVLAEFGGDARAAVRALLHDLAVLASDYEGSVSRGFVRGRHRGRLRRVRASGGPREQVDGG